MIRLKQIGSNMTVLNKSGYEILFSYETPVAVYDQQRGSIYEQNKVSQTHHVTSPSGLVVQFQFQFHKVLLKVTFDDWTSDKIVSIYHPVITNSTMVKNTLRMPKQEHGKFRRFTQEDAMKRWVRYQPNIVEEKKFTLSQMYGSSKQ